jgi:hypothetical protein
MANAPFFESHFYWLLNQSLPADKNLNPTGPLPIQLPATLDSDFVEGATQVNLVYASTPTQTPTPKAQILSSTSLTSVTPSSTTKGNSNGGLQTVGLDQTLLIMSLAIGFTGLGLIL